MPSQDPEVIIKQRIIEANQKEYERKISLITEMLGKAERSATSPYGARADDPYVSTYELRIDHFSINQKGKFWYNRHGMGTSTRDQTLRFDDQIVFELRNNIITGYIPGKWEEAFEDLYQQAAEIQRSEFKNNELKRKKEEEDKQAQQLADKISKRAKFGL